MTNPDFSEKRHFQRILFDAPVTLDLGAATYSSRLIDLSLRGALIQRPLDWPAQATGGAQLRIRLGDDTQIQMEAQLAHGEGDRLGFQCRHIDMDSITHLRRLVELNLGDDALLRRELEELI